MRQYDVFENPSRKARRGTPYLVILQSDVATGPNTVIVAPLAKRSAVPASDRIVVPVQIDGEDYVVLFQLMAAIAKSELGKPVAQLSDLSEALPRAIDYLFLGM